MKSSFSSVILYRPHRPPKLTSDTFRKFHDNSNSISKSLCKYITINLRRNFMQFNRLCCIGFGHAESTNGGAFGHFVCENSSQTSHQVVGRELLPLDSPEPNPMQSLSSFTKLIT